MITKIKQMLCKHRIAHWMIETSKSGKLFFNLSGERQYLVCTKCEKILDERFVRNFDGS